jgi:tight adherence protein C
MSMLLLVAAACLSLSVLAIANLAALPARNRRARIRSAATYGNVKVAFGPERLRFRERVVGPLVTSAARAMLRLNPKQDLESLSNLLMSAGLRNVSPQTFLAAKAGAGGAGLVLGLALGASSSAAAGFVLACMLGAVGYIVPAVLVSARARRRQSILGAELPDALDLLAVSVEAGLGFDGAVAKLTQYMDGPLSEEFELALGGMRIGESRADALKKLGERSGTPEVAAFVRSIIQADQLGTSLGRILRVQATDARLKRQAAAEERAMKAPVKMLFPTVAFIFPAMFIVVLGPAMLSLGKLFGF